MPPLSINKIILHKIPIISSSEAKTIFKEMISEDMFCFRHFGRVTDLIYDNCHKYIEQLMQPFLLNQPKIEGARILRQCQDSVVEMSRQC